MEKKIPEYRYICENKFDEEFGIYPYSETSDQLDANHTTWDKMLNFSRKIAVEYGLQEEDWYRFLWTSFDGDSGTIYLRNGTVFINRLDFWFSKKPWGIDSNKEINDQTMIEVAWEGQEDCEENK